jgi:hypothetical protein
VNSMYLQGSEEVSRAGYTIQGAAETMTRAASTNDEAAARLVRALENHGYMLSALMERVDAKQPRPVIVYQKQRSYGEPVKLEEVGRGMFIEWGNEYEEFENGPGNYTVGIVEMPDGSVQTFMPDCIKFEVQL